MQGQENMGWVYKSEVYWTIHACVLCVTIMPGGGNVKCPREMLLMGECTCE